MNLRAATPADLDALVDVQQEGAVRGLSHIFPQDAHPFPRADVLRRWTNEIADPEVQAYVSVDDIGRVTGFAATRANELLHLGTKVETWGTGLAQEVHNALLDNLTRTAPPGTAYLRLRVFEANLRARRFYERLGWTETQLRTETAFPPHPPLVEYRRPLASRGASGAPR